MIRFQSIPKTTFLPISPTTASASTMMGKARMTSMKRWTIMSVRPPKYAEATPMMAPSVHPPSDDRKPTESAVCEP